MSKTLVVFGATGQQGGSLIAAVLADSQLSKEFRIRAVTRNVTKGPAKALAEKGVEVTSADLNSKESVTKALEGAHTVFLVTNFWETADKDRELAQGKTVADAASETGVKHLIFSSLEHVSKISGGKLPNVSHFDSKAEIEHHIRASGVPATFVLMGFYMSNFLQSLRRGEYGSYTFATPVSKDAQFPLLNTAEDAGKFITPALRQGPGKLNGRKILAAVAYLTPGEIVAQFEKATGKTAKYMQVPGEVWKGFLGMPEHTAQELLENFLLLDTPGYYNGAALNDSLALLTEEDRNNLTTFEKYAASVEEWK